MKVLPIVPQKRISTYLDNAYKCSILFAYDNTTEWYCDKFVQLYSYLSKPDFVKVNYKGANFQSQVYKDVLEIKSFPLQNIPSDIVEYVRTQIDKGLYVEIGLDEFYISNKAVFGKVHFNHPTLIYGYDDSKGLLYVLGYNASQLFSCFTITYQEFVQAQYGYLQNYNPRNNGIAYSTFRVKSELGKINVDIQSFFEELKEYLWCIRFDSNVEAYHSPKQDSVFCFGLDVYSAIKETFSNSMYKPVDSRTYHLLLQHKRELLYKLTFVLKKCDLHGLVVQLLKQYQEEVVLGAEKLFLNVCKAQVTKQWDYAKINSKINDLERAEKDILSSIYEKVSKYIDGLLY